MPQEEKFLVPRDVYLKSGIHIGTKFRTKYMEQFIYKTRPDGLSVLNLQKIDERIRIAVVGRPNVGKSTLVNKLVGYERVMVSNIPGTTRDAIDTSFEMGKMTCLVLC